MRSRVGILSGSYVIVVRRALSHVCGEGAAAYCTEAVTCGTFEQCASPFRSFSARCGSLKLIEMLFYLLLSGHSEVIGAQTKSTFSILNSAVCS